MTQSLQSYRDDDYTVCTEIDMDFGAGENLRYNKMKIEDSIK